MKTARTGFYEIHGPHMEIILDLLEEGVASAREEAAMSNKDAQGVAAWEREADNLELLHSMLHTQAYPDEEAT